MPMYTRAFVASALLATSLAASAHTGHDQSGLIAGLAHPLGVDHLLAMLAVGLWSSQAGRASARLSGPLVFMAALLAGAGAGHLGLMLPLAEQGIAASVALFGLLLIAPRLLPRPAALATVAAAALLHGLAHGAEAPVAASFGSYAAGFLIMTAVLQALGLHLGRRLADCHARALQLMGLVTGLAGIALLAAA